MVLSDKLKKFVVVIIVLECLFWQDDRTYRSIKEEDKAICCDDISNRVPENFGLPFA
jgi:hypothetical protein